MRRTVVSLLVAAAVWVGAAVTAKAQAQGDWIWTVPDFKGFRQDTLTITVPTWIGIDKEIPWDWRIRIGIKDEIKVTIKYPVPIFVPTYIKLSSTQERPFNAATDHIVLTDIYAKDLQRDLGRNEIPFMTGFNPDPALRELIPQGPEQFQGLSGTWYTANTVETTIGQLPSLLPGYDLSKFIGDPTSIVYVAQATVPARDFIGLSSAWVGDRGNHWTDVGSWSPEGDPNAAGHRVVFGWDAFPSLNPTVQLDVDRTVGDLEFHAGADTTIQGPGSLTLLPLDPLAPASIHVAGGSHTIGVNLNAPQGLTISDNDGSTAQWPMLTLAGSTAVTGNLELTRAANVAIRGLTTVTGTTTVNPGSTLTVANGGWLFTDTWINPGKDVVLAGGRADISRNLQVAGAGTFDIGGVVVVGDTTTVEPGARLTVQPGGQLQTRRWVNPGTDIVRPGAVTIVLEDLLVSGVGTFDVGGQVSVGGITTVEPDATLTVQPGGSFSTLNWRNAGRDIVRGLASVGQDLVVGSTTGTPGFFDVFGTADVAGTTTVLPGATLTVQPGGIFTTTAWRNPGKDVVLAGGSATVRTDLTVGDASGVDSFFDVFGELTVQGTTTNLPGGVFTVQEGGLFTTTNWKNPGRDIVRGTARVLQDLEIGDPGIRVDSFFDIFTELTVDGTTTVFPGGTLTVQPGGRFSFGAWNNAGRDVVRTGAIGRVLGNLTIPAGGVFETAGTVDVGGTTQVDPGGTLTVQPGGIFTTTAWRNPGKDVVLAGGSATVRTDLTVGDASGVDSFFDVFGELTVQGTTTNLPGGVFTVQEGGLFTTTNWKNPGRDIVRGTARVLQDLEIGDPGIRVDSFFDIFTELTVGGATTVFPGGTLTVRPGGKYRTHGLRGGGSVVLDGGDCIVTQKPQSWTANPAARQDIGGIIIIGGRTDLTNNLLSVNYGGGPSPYPALADAVNGGAIVQSTGNPDRTVGIYDTALDLDGSTPDSRTVRVGYAAPGDTMMRGYVDSSDIINILSAGKYDAGPSDAKWHEGNFTGADKEVNSDDIIGLLSAGVYDGGTYDAAGGAARPSSVISGPPSSTRATVIYDATTGDVKIDPNGNTMTGFRLKDSAGSFFTSSASFPSGGAFITDTATQKYWSTFSSGSYLTSLWDLGNIAPTGLSEADFLSALNNLSADSTWTKSGGGTFNYNMQYVPEPSGVALLIAGGVGLSVFVVRRRRSARVC